MPITDGSSTTFDFSFVLNDRIDVTLNDGTTVFADQGIDTSFILAEGAISGNTTLFEFGQASFDGQAIDLSYITNYTPADDDNLTLQDQFYLALQNVFEVTTSTDASGNTLYGLQTKDGSSIDFETFTALPGVSLDSTNSTVTVTLPVNVASSTTFDFSFVLTDRIDVTLNDGTTVFADQGIDTSFTLAEGAISGNTTLFEFGQASFDGQAIDLSW